VSLATVYSLTNRDNISTDMYRIRLLLVEEAGIFRDGLANLLAVQKDFEVSGTADSAAKAVEQLRAIRPDIVLLGWSPNSPPSQRVFSAIHDAKLESKVIVLTNEDSKEDFVEAVRQGCCGIVAKQTSTELLLKSIRKVHAGEYWLDRMTTADVIRRLAKKRPASNAPSSRLGVRDQSTALSTREREIVILVAQGFKNKEMAERMFISEQTVKNHLHNIFDKLGVSDRLELALYAIHHNLHEAK
jgi:two-component system, NarL family, nitrate/nitrite response regulator NarL